MENAVEIIVTVNNDGAYRRKRFMGQRLVRWLQATPDGKGTDVVNVYRTASNRYALHTRSIPDWPMSGGDPDYMADPKNWGLGNGLLLKLTTFGYDFEGFKKTGNFSLQVLDSLEGLKAHTSDELYQAVTEALEEPEFEDIDI